MLSWIRAAALYRAGRFDLAARCYETGLRRYPHHSAATCARLDLAYCLFKLGRLEEAERHLRTVTLQNPNSREAHLRLARLQLWTGQALEAAWTIRRALQRISIDAELAGTFLLAVVDADAPSFLTGEALQAARSAAEHDSSNKRLSLALARYELEFGEQEKGRESISALATEEPALFESILAFAEILLEEGKVAHARRQLRRAMQAAPEHPRLLSLLAQSYLREGPFHSADYARQLATQACQVTNWLSPREMHILADAYMHTGDKVSALLMASKAKQAGSRLMGNYRGAQVLDQLIESLASGTLA